MGRTNTLMGVGVGQVKGTMRDKGTWVPKGVWEGTQNKFYLSCHVASCFPWVTGSTYGNHYLAKLKAMCPLQRQLGGVTFYINLKVAFEKVI